MERAWAGYTAAGTQHQHAGILAMLAGCYNSMGDASTATQRLDQVNRQDLDAPTRVPFDTMRAWLALAQGQVPEIVPWLHRCADDLEQDLSALYPDIYDIFNGHFARIPGALAPMRRLHVLARSMRWRCCGCARTIPMPRCGSSCRWSRKRWPTTRSACCCWSRLPCCKHC